MQAYGQINQPTVSTSTNQETAAQQNTHTIVQQTSKPKLLDTLTEIPKIKLFLQIAAVIGIVLLAFTVVPRLVFRPSTLTVVGEGVLEFEAEKVSMIVTRADSGTDSVNTINEGDININLLIESAKGEAGIDAKITQAFYQVQPVALQSGVQYQAVNAFSLETSNVAATNQIIKTLYRDGATTISNVSFSSADKELTAQKARSLAVEDAKKEAKNIAKAAGKRLGRLVSISDDNQTSQSTISNVNPNNQSFSTVSTTKRVSVIYEIW